MKVSNFLPHFFRSSLSHLIWSRASFSHFKPSAPLRPDPHVMESAGKCRGQGKEGMSNCYSNTLQQKSEALGVRTITITVKKINSQTSHPVFLLSVVSFPSHPASPNLFLLTDTFWNRCFIKLFPMLKLFTSSEPQQISLA